MKVFELKTIIEKYAENRSQVAAYYDDRELTYYELNNLINYYFSEFKKMNIKPASPIVVYMSNCIELLVAYLAVLIYGCIIVPIDSETPINRINDIIKISNSKFLLYVDDDIDMKQISCLSYRIKFPKLDNIYDNCKQYKHDMKNDAIYIFTSGSTGAPKGVRLTYKGIENHANSKISLLQLNGQERFCLSFSPSFVASVWQILVPIYLGASMIIYSKDVLKNTLVLLDHIDNDKVSIISLIPHQLYAYCLSLPKRKKLLFSNLKKIILTGEKLEANIVKSFREIYSNIQLINAYGQSECCDDTFHFLIPNGFSEETIPIGVPIQNINYMIIDEKGNSCSDMESGELLISGDCLTNGYINKNDENINKFIFLNGVRYFKTGDLVEKKNELIYFLGRIDNQIKIRGFRIEPEEIEYIAKLYPGVEKSVVVSRKFDTRADSALICGYVSEEEIDINSLKQHLGRYLQEYKIPTVFLKIDKIPLLINGKIDRRATANILNANIGISTLSDNMVNNKTRQDIKNVITSFLGILNCDNCISLVDCGIDSMSFVELVVHLENKYCFEFRDELLVYSHFANIDELVDYVYESIK